VGDSIKNAPYTVKAFRKKFLWDEMRGENPDTFLCSAIFTPSDAIAHTASGTSEGNYWRPHLARDGVCVPSEPAARRCGLQHGITRQSARYERCAKGRAGKAGGKRHRQQIELNVTIAQAV
jgi:hypothetical protein